MIPATLAEITRDFIAYCNYRNWEPSYSTWKEFCLDAKIYVMKQHGDESVPHAIYSEQPEYKQIERLLSLV